MENVEAMFGEQNPNFKGERSSEFFSEGRYSPRSIPEEVRQLKDTVLTLRAELREMKQLLSGSEGQALNIEGNGKIQ